MVQRAPTAKLSSCETPEITEEIKNGVPPFESHAILICNILTFNYFTSSKSTFIHYQCVSTGCCVHVARIKISIDNQHVTKPMQRYNIQPEQPKENTEKSQT